MAALRKIKADERPTVPLDRDEWNFWWRCPETELEECLVYECARRSSFWPFVFKVIQDLRLERPLPSDRSWSRIFEFLELFPEFPAKPWLAIEDKMRSKRLSVFLKRARRWMPIEEVDREELNTKQRTQPKWQQIVFPPLEPNMATSILGRYDVSDGEGPCWDSGWDILSEYRDDDRLHDGRFTVFRIDWRNTDDSIRSAFNRWMNAARPADYGMYNRRGSSPIRPDKLKAALRALGAWSISPKLNPHAPPSLTDEFILRIRYKDENSAQTGVYSSRSELKRGRAAALQAIGKVNPRLLHFPFEGKRSVRSRKRVIKEMEYTAVIATDGIRFYQTS